MEELRHRHLMRGLRGPRPVASRLGFMRHRLGRSLPNRPLPSIQCLARELCAQRGLDILPHGVLPSGGTVAIVDDLSFDKALVLLSLFEDARVYSDRVFAACGSEVQGLSLRSARQIASLVESVVADLSSARVVIMSAAHYASARKQLALRAPSRRVHVDLSNPLAVQVLAEV